MATLTIVIKGIALITEEGGTWNIYMPFGGCHEAKLKRQGDAGPAINLNHPGQKLNISVGNVLPTLSAGTNFGKFFDVTSRDAHADGVTLRDDWNDGSVRISIPGGTYSAAVSSEDFFLTDDNPRPTLQKNLGAIGTIGTVVIDADDIAVNATGTVNFTWPFPEGGKITIDNDCLGIVPIGEVQKSLDGEKDAGNDGKENNRDFQLLYNVIRDATDENRRFQVASESGAIDLPCNNNRATKLISKK
jgi:hypothetical protein